MKGIWSSALMVALGTLGFGGDARAASQSIRVVAPSDLRIDLHAPLGHSAIEALLAEATLAGLRIPAEVEVRGNLWPALAAGGVMVLELRGSLRGTPIAEPLVRGLADAHGNVVLLTRAEPVDVPKGPMRPTLTASDAIQRLEASGLPGSTGAREAELAVVPRPGGSRLMWRIDPAVDLSVPTNPVFGVDAHSGAIVTFFDRIRMAKVEVFRTNPVHSPVAEIFDLSAVDPMPQFLTGPYFRARNCIQMTPGAECVPQATVMPDVNGDYFVDVPDVSIPADNIQLEDPFAEVSAYFHADRFNAWLQSIGFEGIPCVASGDGATLVANYRQADVDGEPGWFFNAFYTGACTQTAIFGQGPQTDLAYDGDIVYHELGHGMVEKQVPPDSFLGLTRVRPDAVSNDAGALNEGFADFFSSAFIGDPLVAEYAGISRDNANDFTCPSGLTGEPHDDSEIMAAALYEIHEVLGVPFYLAVLDAISMLPNDASFEEASVAIETTTEVAMGSDAADTVHEVMVERNLLDCGRYVPADALSRNIWLFPPSWDLNFTPVRPPPFQIAFEGPSGALSARLSFTEMPFVPDNPSPLALIVKRDAPIEFTYEESPDLFTVDADSTEQYMVLGGEVEIPIAEGELAYGALVLLGGNGTLLAEPNVTYEVEDLPSETGSSGGVDESTGNPDSTTTGMSGVATADEGTGTDTDDPATQGTDGGCGCRHTGGGLLSLPILGLLLATRRRNR